MITFEILTAVPPAFPVAQAKRIGQVLSAHFHQKYTGIVSLSFFSESKMKALNHTTRGKDCPTDVLSYPASQLSGFRTHKGEALLGDIVVCAPYAAREAKRRSIPIKEELTRLIIHGVLHLRGYDHDTDEKEAVMFALQEKCVAAALL